MKQENKGQRPAAPVLSERDELNEEAFDELEDLDQLDDEPEELEEDDAPLLIVTDDSESEEKVHIMALAADSVRAEDIVALDLRQLTIIADFFLICTGKSSIQIRAIADRMEEKMRDQGYRKLRVEGYQEATWILLDYGDVVCHVMAAEQRAFYNLEEFWSSAPHLELDLTPEPTTLNAPRTHFESLTPVGEEFGDDDMEDTL